MVDPSVEFLALTAHPQVGRWIADRHVTVVFDPHTRRLVWSNGAGADMLEAHDLADLNHPTARQQILVAELARLLSESSDQSTSAVYGQIRGKILLPVGVYQVTITCSAYPLISPARPGLYLVTMSWTLREREEKWPLTQFCQLIAGRRTATIADPSGMYFVSTNDEAKALVGQTMVSTSSEGLRHALATLPGTDVHLIGGLDLYLVLMDPPTAAAQAAVRALSSPQAPGAAPVPPPVPGRPAPPPLPPRAGAGPRPPPVPPRMPPLPRVPPSEAVSPAGPLPVPPPPAPVMPPPVPVASSPLPVPPPLSPPPGAPVRPAGFPSGITAPPPVPVPPPGPAAAPGPPPASVRPPAPPERELAGEAPRPRHFAWQMDADQRFTYVSDRLAEALGAPPGYPMGLGWQDLASDPGFDPEGHVSAALAAREPWGGLTVYWPTNDGLSRIPVDLSGLAISGTTGFAGYRGFGLARIAEARPLVRVPPPQPAPPPMAPNVIVGPFDPGLSRLTRPEEAAFRQIAEALGARYEGDSGRSRPSASLPPQRPASPPALDPRVLIERLPLAVIVARGEEILALNSAALSLLDYPDRAAIDARGGLAAILGNRPEGRAPQAENGPLRLATGTGGTVDVRARIAPVPWTDGMAALVTLEPAHPDISTLALSVSGDGVLVLDATGRIASADNRASEILSWPVDALVGLDPTTLVTTADAARTLADACRGEAMPAMALETTIFLPEEGERPVRIGVGHLVAGPIQRVVLLLTDLSSTRTRETDLEAALKTADRAIERKSALLSHLGQELRTPLNAIIGFAEVMLEERLGPLGTPRYREFMRDIRASGAHILSLVNDLVDLSRIESGRPDPAPANACDLNPVVREAIDLMQDEAQAERVLVRSSLGASLPQMRADPANVRRIVLNLLSNAIRYNVAGGQAIVSTAYDDGNGLVIRIRDTGVGMTREEIAAALDPERQKSLVATATADGPAGSGLGLPLAKALTEASGGTFRLVSQPGQGTLVEVALPFERT